MGLFRVFLMVSLFASALTLTQPAPGRAAENPCQESVKQSLIQLLKQADPFPYESRPMKVGVEVEGRVPRSIGLERLGERIRDVLARHDPSNAQGAQSPVKLEFDEAHGWNAAFSYRGSDGKMKTFRVKKDETIPETRELKGVEITSPILETEQDRAVFFEVMDELRAAGMQALPGRAGVHVHVDFHSPEGLLGSRQELVALRLLFSRIEQDVLKAFSTAEKRRNWAKPTDEQVRRALESLAAVLTSPGKKEVAAAPFSKAEIKNQGPDRARALNVESLNKSHGTVEFRLFNSTLSPGEIDLMIDFSDKLVRAVRTQDSRLVRFLESTSWEQVSLPGLARALDMKLVHSPEILEAIALQARQTVSTWEQAGELGRRMAIPALIVGGVAGAVAAYQKFATPSGTATPRAPQIPASSR